jgi:hypothetical protein
MCISLDFQSNMYIYIYIIGLVTIFQLYYLLLASRSVGAVYDIGLRPLACWDCGFESQRVHECSSVVSVVCCQVEVSALS